MADWLQKAWFNHNRWVWLLAPLALLFWVLSSSRRFLFKVGILGSTKSSLPVIVVGNIGIGGNGKTPLVIALVEQLRERGFTPAVISRGYGGKQTHFPYLVNAKDSANVVGDEPLLIMQRVQCDLVIDPKRSRAVKYIEQHSAANVIICDDGLQHYAMGRDIEICVVDKRGLGNGYLLPMGPLREGPWRLNTVDKIVHNIGVVSSHLKISQSDQAKKTEAEGIDSKANLDANAHVTKKITNRITNNNVTQDAMTLVPTFWVNVATGVQISIEDFQSHCQIGQLPILALAGIGEPQRFFSTLKSINIACDISKGYPDHYAFKKADLPHDHVVLMTQKDAVKCVDIAHDNCWYLQIDGVLNKQFFNDIANTLN